MLSTSVTRSLTYDCSDIGTLAGSANLVSCDPYWVKDKGLE